MASGQQREADRPAVAVGMLKDGALPTIDGKVDDEVWKNVAPFTAFTQQEPDEGQPASERTEIRFLVDKKNLYIGVIAFDREPDRIVVSQSRRDADLNDTDSIQILLDTLNDGLNAFVFGTNPFGIEYDGQVMNEGQTSGSQGRSGGGGSQGGQVSGFNANWDADWTVRASITDRGWEAEFSIPLKSVRYRPGTNQTWGLNAMRIIRRRNEQAFLAPVPRGYNIHRVSVAGRLTGLDLPDRRQFQVIPYGLGSVSDNKTLATDQRQNDLKIGLDSKIGLTSTLTLDATVNTDFAQVEADEQQVNLTRFALFFPEKRPFFLENAQTFQLGQPQAIDLFFSRRIGIGPNGAPIPILGGARLSGKAGHYNVGVLNMQTASTEDRQTGAAIAPSNNFTVARVQREIGRSNVGAMFVNRQASGSFAGTDDYNRAYGVDAAVQATPNGKLFTFLARTDSPASKGGSDYAGRAFYSYANAFWTASGGYAQVGDHFNPEVGFVSRKGYRALSSRAMITYDPDCCDWIRRWSPHMFYNAFFDLDGKLSTAQGHWHPFDIQQANGGRFGISWNTEQDNPRVPFVLYSDAEGTTVVVPAGEYSWQFARIEFDTDPSANVWMTLRAPVGGYYDGGSYYGWESTFGARMGARFITSVGWTRNLVNVPYGKFTNDLIPIKVGYSFTSLASLEGLLQYNSQTATFSSNIRFALLNRSGTGLFVVFNNQQDTSRLTPTATLGRSFVVKMSRLFDF
ncbi:MAG: carbohydrate binding family 9 domain-containing protein [Vicinamibacterales bacterium]|nr:carbohydrate binding family 9 domain-containing protein [Vicinamibacterales bacterium]